MEGSFDVRRSCNTDFVCAVCATRRDRCPFRCLGTTSRDVSVGINAFLCPGQFDREKPREGTLRGHIHGMCAGSPGPLWTWLTCEPSRRPEAVHPLAARANPTHPLDFLLHDLGLADVPPGVKAPRDEGEGLLRDRLRLLEIRRDPDDRKGPGGRRVQVASLLVDARVVQLRTGLPDAVLVDLQLLSGPRMGTVSHGNDVLADRRPMREPEGRREMSFREALTGLEEIIL